MVNGDDFHLRLHRIARLHPGIETAKQGANFCITVMQQNERRTGARVFVRSGATGDDPLIFGEVNTNDVRFEFIQRNG